MDDPCSMIERVKFGAKETATHLLTADNLSARKAPDGSAVLELFRYGNDGIAKESYRFHLCPEDLALLKRQL